MYITTIRKSVSEYSYLYHDGQIEGDIVDQSESNTLREARKQEKLLIKKHNLKKCGFDYFNHDTGIVLSTNY